MLGASPVLGLRSLARRLGTRRVPSDLGGNLRWVEKSTGDGRYAGAHGRTERRRHGGAW